MLGLGLEYYEIVQNLTRFVVFCFFKYVPHWIGNERRFLCVKPLAKRMQREKKKHTDGNEIIKSYLRKQKWCLQSAKNRESSTGKRTVFCRIDSDSYGKMPKSNNSVEFAVNIFPKYIYQKQEQKKK